MQDLKSSAAHIPPASGSYPARTGNFIRPLIDGEPAFRRICEAVEAAQHSVWVAVSFIGPDFEMPDGRGSLFDVLDKAVARGLDVRALFWRNNKGSGLPEEEIFSGLPPQREMLQQRGSRFHARWDRAQKAYCQHQKSWLIDAGQETETTFVGGINLQRSSVSRPGHVTFGGHDVYAELRGPSATDVHHNFVQRWNEASERLAADGCWPPDAQSSNLPFPVTASPARGDVMVQAQRTVRAGHYTDEQPTPGGPAWPIAKGEFSIYDQYRSAIHAAQRGIYIENQTPALGLPDIVEDIHAALERGVQVVCVIPAGAGSFAHIARQDPRTGEFFRRFGELDRHPNFTLAGIAVPSAGAAMRDIYVHSKLMLIDDAWATIGSCNMWSRSFFADMELNLSFWSADVVKRLRCELFTEHIEADTSALDDIEALRLFAQIARRNAERGKANGRDWQGMAFRLEAASYAT
jgi:phosphatidylserine/phosphatidylglycerophosphate/cardiolipin synthase-like enzyme